MFDFLHEALDSFEYTQQLRRDFHRHPEIGFEEFRTAGIVARELNSLGLEVTTGIGQTGVIALLEGKQAGPTALLRFDMDALPINEETGSEDMAFIMQEIPGCFFFIGSANSEKGLDAAHHHPRFDFDEQALSQGAALMATVASEYLNQK